MGPTARCGKSVPAESRRSRSAAANRRRVALRDLSPSLLVVEITEEFLLSNLNRALKVLQELHELGVRIAIDDFGTGYSALSYLRELPIDEVKLDRSFIAAITADRRAAPLVRTVIDLAETLGLTAVAQGVENVETARVLASYGCAVAQGYFCGRPLPITELLEHLAEPTACCRPTRLPKRDAASITCRDPRLRRRRSP